MGPWQEKRRALETLDVPFRDYGISSLHVCSRDVSIYRLGVETIRKIVVIKKDTFAGLYNTNYFKERLW